MSARLTIEDNSYKLDFYAGHFAIFHKQTGHGVSIGKNDLICLDEKFKIYKFTDNTHMPAMKVEFNIYGILNLNFIEK